MRPAVALLELTVDDPRPRRRGRRRWPPGSKKRRVDETGMRRDLRVLARERELRAASASDQRCSDRAAATRTSASALTNETPSHGAHHRLTSSGSVHSSLQNTERAPARRTFAPYESTIEHAFPTPSGFALRGSAAHLRFCGHEVSPSPPILRVSMKRVELVEARIPDLAIALEPVVKFAQRLGSHVRKSRCWATGCTSTSPASLSTRRCLDTCGWLSWRRSPMSFTARGPAATARRCEGGWARQGRRTSRPRSYILNLEYSCQGIFKIAMPQKDAGAQSPRCRPGPWGHVGNIMLVIKKRQTQILFTPKRNVAPREMDYVPLPTLRFSADQPSVLYFLASLVCVCTDVCSARPAPDGPGRWARRQKALAAE